MSVPLLYLKNATISFGGKPLFDALSLQLIRGEKVALIGKNGSGKSTLLKVIAGLNHLDEGEIYIHPRVTIGYLAQETYFPAGITIYDYVLENVVSDINSLNSHKHLADIVLEGLKLDGKRVMDMLSGGKLRRAALAKSLINKPDVLLLDEPTNHLDIESIEWLERYVNNYDGAIICISHDREFLNKISNTMYWLDRGILRHNKQGFSTFDEWSKEVIEQESNNLRKLDRKVQEENVWLQQGVTARRKRNQGRLKDLMQLRSKLKGDQNSMNRFSTHVKLPPLSENLSSKLVVEMEDVSFSFADYPSNRAMLRPFSMRIMRGEKIGIIGANGTGKTTFLRLLIGELQPTTGIIKLGTTVQVSYFDQKRDSLDDNKTLWETLCSDYGDTVKVGGQPRHVIAYLKDFLFTSEQAKSKVSSLSGGEANRLLLAKILANPGNLLILDEPTNDLDMDTLEVLNEMLHDYSGTLIIVSHDRDFIERLVTRTIIFPGGGRIEDYIGGYQDYLNVKNNQQYNKPKPKTGSTNQQNKNNNTNNNTRLSYKHKRDLELIPKQIEELETAIKSLEQKMADSELYTKDQDAFHRAADELTSKQVELQKLEQRWLELHSML
jgi:ATP-binding cassette subfamily F protein uup